MKGMFHALQNAGLTNSDAHTLSEIAGTYKQSPVTFCSGACAISAKSNSKNGVKVREGAHLDVCPICNGRAVYHGFVTHGNGHDLSLTLKERGRK